MKYIAFLAICACSLLVSCREDSGNPVANSVSMENKASLTPGIHIQAQSSSGSENGRAGSMPAYYDSTRFTINFKELSAQAEGQLIAHDQSINTIYMSDNGLPNNQMFVSVLDAIQGDGFNPLWREVQIAFNSGFTPRQLFSDTEIEAAASGNHPEITLQVTDEVYRCSVIGPNKQ